MKTKTMPPPPKKQEEKNRKSKPFQEKIKKWHKSQC